MINLEKVEFQNFGPFPYQEFNFVPGKHLILGNVKNSITTDSNGSGKSILLESIGWGIYKESPRGKDISFDHRGDCFVKVHFSVDENKYRIERYYKHKEQGNSIKLICNEEDISNKNIKDIENQILSLGFPPYDLFVSTIVVLQGMPLNFSQMSLIRRKEILEELFGFNVWNQYRTKLKKYNDTLVVAKGDIETRYNENQSKIISLTSKIDTLKIVNKTNLTDIETELGDIQKRSKELQTTFFTKDASLKKIEFNPETYEQIIKDTQHYKQEHNLCEKILRNKDCPTCGQPYPTEKLEKAQYKLDKALGALITLDKDYNTQKEIKVTYDTLRTDITKIETEIMDLKAQSRKLSSKKENNTQTNDSDIKELEINLEKLTEQDKIVSIELDYIKTKIKNTKYIDELLLPSSQFRTTIMQKYLSYINTIIESICPSIFGELELKLVIDEKAKGIEIYLTKNQKEFNYGELSGGQKKRLDIILILSLQKFLLESSGININLIGFDEIFDGLDLKGIETVINTLDYMYDQETCIYLISHNYSIKEMFSSVYLVENDGQTSQVA